MRDAAGQRADGLHALGLAQFVLELVLVRRVVALGDEGVDGVLVILTPQAMTKPVEVAEAVVEDPIEALGGTGISLPGG